ncbi:cell division protein FtsZ [Candidatus Kaiserbacteria bacterium RIFCSPHIGHO2_01_FULL_48_10]|uniref:Cell division protein FtsZ n=1 Tax=Candidatus Kaiserbacteria bacterium RIFCSPHIGHO2_01_FULL_48_10 TaxID=1798476 RepID=A0A1F6C2N7_9BACT|nr:MAG: cell division protein FtsZ [Candidatus Kaiserbacteria bacterium RIFCSPHIGHO2_01_FULL_48_10]
MPQVHSEMESAARIRVVGVGGSGKNAINHMVNARVRGVDFMVINTDAQDLQQSGARMKIHIGKNLTRGLGAGMNPAVGKRAAEETQSEIQDALRGSDMVFIAGGMGGGTCTGAAPIVAKIAKDSGALTVAVVTKPFSFEGQQRMRLAEQGLEELRKEVDALIVIPNDRLLAVVDQTTTVKSAFAMCDEVLRQAVEGVSDLITTPGNINLDFADIKAIMADAGSALMGVGLAAGDKRSEEAARLAINSPLLDISINGAKGVLLSIAGGEDLGLLEVQAAAQIVTESIDKNAKVIFGTSKDDRLKKGEVRVTVIATGFADDVSTGRGQPLFQLGAKKEKKEREEEPAGKIYNTVIPTPLRDEETVAPVRRQQEEPTPKPMEEDDDWSAVPAFLRRSKKN